MTPLQMRRRDVCDAIAEHVATVGHRDWKSVLARFPDLSPANFWRWRREVLTRLECEASDQTRAESIDNDRPPQSEATPPDQISRGAAESDPSRQIRADERLSPPFGPMAWLSTDAQKLRHKAPPVVFGPFKPRKSQRTTMGELLNQYDAAVLSKLRTGASQRKSLALVLEPLADKICADFKLEDIVPLIAARPPVHANRILAYLNALCGWAFDQRLVDYVPPFPALMEADESPRERSLTLGEVAEVWRAAEAIGPPFGAAVQLLILTAARREDVAGMRKSDVYKTSRKQPFWYLFERNHGERERFRVPLSPMAFDLVETVWSASPAEQDLLFTTTGTTAISGWSKVKRKLDATIHGSRVKAGGEHAHPMAPWRLNDLRRSFFDLLTERLGEDPFIAGRCLNRMTECKTTEDRFWASAGDMFEVRLSAMSKWADLVQGEVATTR